MPTPRNEWNEPLFSTKFLSIVAVATLFLLYYGTPHNYVISLSSTLKEFNEKLVGQESGVDFLDTDSAAISIEPSSVVYVCDIEQGIGEILYDVSRRRLLKVGLKESFATLNNEASISAHSEGSARTTSRKPSLRVSRDAPSAEKVRKLQSSRKKVSYNTNAENDIGAIFSHPSYSLIGDDHNRRQISSLHRYRWRSVRLHELCDRNSLGVNEDIPIHCNISVSNARVHDSFPPLSILSDFDSVSSPSRPQRPTYFLNGGAATTDNKLAGVNRSFELEGSPMWQWPLTELFPLPSVVLAGVSLHEKLVDQSLNEFDKYLDYLFAGGFLTPDKSHKLMYPQSRNDASLIRRPLASSLNFSRIIDFSYLKEPHSKGHFSELNAALNSSIDDPLIAEWDETVRDPYVFGGRHARDSLVFNTTKRRELGYIFPHLHFAVSSWSLDVLQEYEIQLLLGGLGRTCRALHVSYERKLAESVSEEIGWRRDRGCDVTGSYKEILSGGWGNRSVSVEADRGYKAHPRSPPKEFTEFDTSVTRNSRRVLMEEENSWGIGWLWGKVNSLVGSFFAANNEGLSGISSSSFPHLQEGLGLVDRDVAIVHTVHIELGGSDQLTRRLYSNIDLNTNLGGFQNRLQELQGNFLKKKSRKLSSVGASQLLSSSSAPHFNYSLTYEEELEQVESVDDLTLRWLNLYDSLFGTASALHFKRLRARRTISTSTIVRFLEEVLNVNSSLNFTNSSSPALEEFAEVIKAHQDGLLTVHTDPAFIDNDDLQSLFSAALVNTTRRLVEKEDNSLTEFAGDLRRRFFGESTDDDDNKWEDDVSRLIFLEKQRKILLRYFLNPPSLLESPFFVEDNPLFQMSLPHLRSFDLSGESPSFEEDEWIGRSVGVPHGRMDESYSLRMGSVSADSDVTEFHLSMLPDVQDARLPSGVRKSSEEFRLFRSQWNSLSGALRAGSLHVVPTVLRAHSVWGALGGLNTLTSLLEPFGQLSFSSSNNEENADNDDETFFPVTKTKNVDEQASFLSSERGMGLNRVHNVLGTHSLPASPNGCHLPHPNQLSLLKSNISTNLSDIWISPFLSEENFTAFSRSRWVRDRERDKISPIFSSIDGLAWLPWLEDGAVDAALPAPITLPIVLLDQPLRPWRVHTLDLSQKFSGLEELLQIVDAVAMARGNTLRLVLNGPGDLFLALRSFSHSRNRNNVLTELSRSNIRSLVTYAAERGIRVVPDIEISSFLLGIVPPRWRDIVIPCPLNEGGKGNFTHIGFTLDPTSELTYLLLEQVIGEFSELFPDSNVFLRISPATLTCWSNLLDLSELPTEQEGPTVRFTSTTSPTFTSVINKTDVLDFAGFKLRNRMILSSRRLLRFIDMTAVNGALLGGTPVDTTNASYSLKSWSRMQLHARALIERLQLSGHDLSVRGDLNARDGLEGFGLLLESLRVRMLAHFSSSTNHAPEELERVEKILEEIRNVRSFKDIGIAKLLLQYLLARTGAIVRSHGRSPFFEDNSLSSSPLKNVEFGSVPNSVSKQNDLLLSALTSMARNSSIDVADIWLTGSLLASYEKKGVEEATKVYRARFSEFQKLRDQWSLFQDFHNALHLEKRTDSGEDDDLAWFLGKRRLKRKLGSDQASSYLSTVDRQSKAVDAIASVRAKFRSSGSFLNYIPSSELTINEGDDSIFVSETLSGSLVLNRDLDPSYISDSEKHSVHAAANLSFFPFESLFGIDEPNSNEISFLPPPSGLAVPRPFLLKTLLAHLNMDERDEKAFDNTYLGVSPGLLDRFRVIKSSLSDLNVPYGIQGYLDRASFLLNESWAEFYDQHSLGDAFFPGSLLTLMKLNETFIPRDFDLELDYPRESLNGFVFSLKIFVESGDNTTILPIMVSLVTLAHRYNSEYALRGSFRAHPLFPVPYPSFLYDPFLLGGVSAVSTPPNAPLDWIIVSDRIVREGEESNMEPVTLEQRSPICHEFPRCFASLERMYSESIFYHAFASRFDLAPFTESSEDPTAEEIRSSDRWDEKRTNAISAMHRRSSQIQSAEDELQAIREGLKKDSAHDLSKEISLRILKWKSQLEISPHFDVLNNFFYSDPDYFLSFAKWTSSYHDDRSMFRKETLLKQNKADSDSLMLFTAPRLLSMTRRAIRQGLPVTPLTIFDPNRKYPLPFDMSNPEDAKYFPYYTSANDAFPPLPRMLVPPTSTSVSSFKDGRLDVYFGNGFCGGRDVLIYPSFLDSSGEISTKSRSLDPSLSRFRWIDNSSSLNSTITELLGNISPFRSAFLTTLMTAASSAEFKGIRSPRASLVAMSCVNHLRKSREYSYLQRISFNFTISSVAEIMNRHNCSLSASFSECFPALFLLRSGSDLEWGLSNSSSPNFLKHDDDLGLNGVPNLFSPFPSLFPVPMDENITWGRDFPVEELTAVEISVTTDVGGRKKLVLPGNYYNSGGLNRTYSRGNIDATLLECMRSTAIHGIQSLNSPNTAISANKMEGDTAQILPGSPFSFGIWNIRSQFMSKPRPFRTLRKVVKQMNVDVLGLVDVWNWDTFYDAQEVSRGSRSESEMGKPPSSLDELYQEPPIAASFRTLDGDDTQNTVDSTVHKIAQTKHFESRATALGYSYAHLLRTRTGRGMAILSKIPFSVVLEDTEHFQFGLLTVDVAGLRIVFTHLSELSARARLRESLYIAGLIKDYDRRGLPVLVMGDLSSPNPLDAHCHVAQDLLRRSAASSLALKDHPINKNATDGLQYLRTKALRREIEDLGDRFLCAPNMLANPMTHPFQDNMWVDELTSVDIAVVRSMEPCENQLGRIHPGPTFVGSHGLFIDYRPVLALINALEPREPSPSTASEATSVLGENRWEGVFSDSRNFNIYSRTWAQSKLIDLMLKDTAMIFNSSLQPRNRSEFTYHDICLFTSPTDIDFSFTHLLGSVGQTNVFSHIFFKEAAESLFIPLRTMNVLASPLFDKTRPTLSCRVGNDHISMFGMSLDTVNGSDSFPVVCY